MCTNDKVRLLKEEIGLLEERARLLGLRAFFDEKERLFNYICVGYAFGRQIKSIDITERQEDGCIEHDCRIVFEVETVRLVSRFPYNGKSFNGLTQIRYEYA